MTQAVCTPELSFRGVQSLKSAPSGSVSEILYLTVPFTREKGVLAAPPSQVDSRLWSWPHGWGKGVPNIPCPSEDPPLPRGWTPQAFGIMLIGVGVQAVRPLDSKQRRGGQEAVRGGAPQRGC